MILYTLSTKWKNFFFITESVIVSAFRKMYMNKIKFLKYCSFYIIYAFLLCLFFNFLVEMLDDSKFFFACG